MATYLEQSLEKLKEFEGCVPWMYRDTAGHVTVGIGLMLPTAHAATALPFAIGDAAASPAQVAAEFARVNALPEGRTPAFYRRTSSPELPMSSIEDRLRSVLVSFEAQLRQHLSWYDPLPDQAKLALLDMAYNLGVSGLLHGYPRLLAAIQARKWVTAGEECFRHGVAGERNAWTRLELLAAAAAAGVVDEVKATAARLRPLLRWTVVAATSAALAWFALEITRRYAGRGGGTRSRQAGVRRR